jgi:hypothetical protein
MKTKIVILVLLILGLVLPFLGLESRRVVIIYSGMLILPVYNLLCMANYIYKKSARPIMAPHGYLTTGIVTIIVIMLGVGALIAAETETLSLVGECMRIYIFLLASIYVVFLFHQLSQKNTG